AESLANGAIGVINPDQFKNLNLIIQSGHRLINLVNDILDFSKLKNRKLSLQCGSVDLVPIVEDVIGLYQAQAQIQRLSLTAEIEPDLPRLWADSDRIHQILHNLVGNALKFTEQGSIVLRVKPIGGAEPSELQLSVSDTGVGIAPENRESIFGAFKQGDGTTARRYSGTGLGLAITRQLVELHHGNISVESTVGEGSTFLVTLPLAEFSEDKIVRRDRGDRPLESAPELAPELTPELAPESATGLTDQSSLSPPEESEAVPEEEEDLILVGGDRPDSESDAPEDNAALAEQALAEQALAEQALMDETLLTRSNLFQWDGLSHEEESSLFRILIVDDEPINQKVLVDYLGHGFYEVRAVSSGPAALQVVLEENWLPNIILMDVMMPRMSGYEVTQKLREVYSSGDLPVIMLTAKNQPSDIVQGLEVGANDYLAKPVSKRVLLARLKTHLELSHITLAYARFVPHEFLDLLRKDSIVEVELGDQVEQEMAVLFSDIRAFTTLSETMNPSENFQFINAYLSRMEPVIHKHGGFIDKFIGDAIMALFPGGSQMAIAAGIEMLQTLERYNEERVQKGWQPIEIGIGINEGQLRLGTVGGQARMSGTAIGDAVNLAARLESLTKTYKTPMLISQNALISMTDPSLVQLRFVDRQQVKGKSVPVAIFEVLDGLNPEMRDR
ncbi:MAG: ATP-binding protein, partial [Cyanobacteria bacterium P01_H01_bin.130]